MKPRFLSLLAGLLIAAAARGQAVPKVTKEGRGAYERLLAACARDGALKVAKKPDGEGINNFAGERAGSYKG